MRLFNDGNGAVITSVGRIEPKTYLDVPDGEAKRLIGMYETLKDAKAMIGLGKEEKEKKEDKKEDKKESKKDKK